MTNKENAPDSNEETIYATALSEIQTDSVRPGLWAKAFADSEGDENKCKALYIRLRVQHEKDRIQQEHHSAHLAAVEAAQRKSIAFQHVIDNLSSCGYAAKRTTSGWTIREPLGGRLKLKSDQALLDYAQGRTTIPAELSSKQATGDQFDATEAMPIKPHSMDGIAASSMQTDTRSNPEALATEDPRQRVQPGSFFSRLANGEYGLAKTYWLFGVLVGVVTNIIAKFVVFPGALAVLAFIGYTAYEIPVLLGVWRASETYTGPKVWAVLAKIAVVLGWLWLAAGLIIVVRLLGA